MEVCSCNHCCIGKAINITYSECVYATLGIQHAMHMPHTVICVLPRLKYFSKLSHKQHYFKKKVTAHKMCFDFLYNICLKHFSFQEEWARYDKKIYIGLHVKYPSHLLKNTQISNFMKICPIGSSVVPCRKMDRHDKANNRSLQFCKRAYNKAKTRTYGLSSSFHPELRPCCKPWISVLFLKVPQHWQLPLMMPRQLAEQRCLH
jgi:hypothetical protein